MTAVLNLFPALVTEPDGATIHKTCRVVADGRDLTVWRWDGDAPAIVLEAPATAWAGNGPRWTVQVGGQLWTVDRQGGCGCGHPLKSLTPQRTPGARRLYTVPSSQEPAPDAP